MLLIILSLITGSYAVAQTTFSYENFKIPSILERIQIESGASFTYDYLTNSGGEDSAPKNAGAFDFFLLSDLSKYTNIKGEVMAHFGHLERFGNNEELGDIQIASNIDVNSHVNRMIDLWYQQHWGDNTKTLIGLHDLSSEFNVTTSSLNFLNSSFGTGAEISYSGINGPSLYPFTSLGFRVLHQLKNNISIASGIYDGDPGAEATYSSFHSDVGGKDGYFFINEISAKDKKHKHAFGIWTYTNPRVKFTDSGEESKQKEKSFGGYLLSERSITDFTNLFFRFGWSNPNVAIVQSNVALGGTYRGIFQTKKSTDELGIGISHVQLSKGHAKTHGVRPTEISYEMYYQIKLSSLVTLRPDTQYIHSPSGSGPTTKIWVLGLRTIVEI